MISVRSRRQPLSGNKWFVFLCMGLVLGACSPKIQPTAKPQLPPPVSVQKPVVPVPVTVVPAVQTRNISLLLPFDLAQSDTPSDDAILAIDYYQGFKFALDSLTAKGYNYKLQVFDSNSNAAGGHSLAQNPKVRASDLIVGPVFPESLKQFTVATATVNKPIISPLSPAPPSDYKDANLVTIMPPLAYHAVYTAKFILQRMKPVKIFLLKSGYSEENKFILPFDHAVDTIGKGRVTIIPITVVHGNLDALIPQLSKTGENIFVIPATDEPFLLATMPSLDKLAQSYPITVFGHPNWLKATYLQPELLQRLKTHITTADRINYKSPRVNDFIRNYKKIYHIEPTEYAIKGFDEGYYLGGLLSVDPAKFKQLDQYNYSGLLNDFNFKKTEGNGWVNTQVRMLLYQNFDLKPVE